jgi:hypothetical protein
MQCERDFEILQWCLQPFAALSPYKLCLNEFSSYRVENTLSLHYTEQSFNVV